MSPRRRLRTRYEPGAVPVAPSAPAPVPEPAEAPRVAPAAAGGPLLADHASIAEPAAEPSAEAIAAPPGPQPAPVPVTAPVPIAAPVPGRPPAEVIEEWARAFEEPVPAAVPAAPAATPAAKPRRRFAVRLRTVLTWLALALLAFATGLILFNNLVMPRLIHSVGQVTVPDLTNLTFEQAEHALRPLGLQVSRAGERFDAAAPRGFVVSQDPTSGSTVRGRKRVAVIVSLGEEYSSVPELFGESMRGARVLLERAGLQQGSIVQAPSDEAGEGLVAASDPGAEAVLQRNTPVHVLVSTGTEAESFVMPELLGREIGGVRRQLEAMGFRIERTGSRNSVGTIVAQVPAPGSRITRATVIQLMASGRIIR